MTTPSRVSRRVAGVALWLCVFIAACDRPDSNPQPQPAGGAAAGATSAPGCPGAITVASGTGAGEVPVMFLAPSGIGFGPQISTLLKEFNARAAEIGFRHCLSGGCMCRYIPAEEKHIVYDSAQVGGWTEVTILGTGGLPTVLPAGLKRRARVVPPSPNVVCDTLPPMPPRPPRPTLPPTPTPTPAPPPVECRQPTWSKAAGTTLVEKRFPFNPNESGKANEALADYIANGLNADIDSVLRVWRAEIDAECRQLNPGAGAQCSGDFDAEPTFAVQSGDGGTGAQLHMYYRIKLAKDVKGRCTRPR